MRQICLRNVGWIVRDNAHLYVAIENDVDPSRPMKTEQRWGGNEAAELAFALETPKNSPTIVLRGYTGGRFESSGDAHAHAAVVRQAAVGVSYAARIVVPNRWTAEWKIPLTALGLGPDVKGRRLLFNLSVRKTSPSCWAMWRNTGGNTWEVWNAGILRLGQ